MAIVIMLVIGVPLVAMPVAVSVAVLYAVRIYLFIYLSIVFSSDLYVVYGFVCIWLCLDWPFLTMCLSGVVPQSGMVLCCFSFHSGVGLNTGLGCRVLCLVTPLGLCLPCWVVFLPL